MRALLLLLLTLWGPGARAAEAFLRQGDVISFIGGQKMVEAAEGGDLELALTALAPELHLRFRSLAREGDTVFEQHRDLNYPSLEEQLASIGTTVIFARFGSMEKLAGASEADFITAYEALLQRLSGNNTRRVVLLVGYPSEPSYGDLIAQLAKHHGWRCYGMADVPHPFNAVRSGEYQLPIDSTAACIMGLLGRESGSFHMEVLKQLVSSSTEAGSSTPRFIELRRLVTAKNLLWYHYYRPQNWAFLAGDRTSQPSSRDHLDPTKRWFPDEMKNFLPLIEAKEKEIDALVAAP